MSTEAIQISIPFDSLAASLSALSLDDKRRLLKLLDDQIAQAEEEEWERDPDASAQMQAARDDYAAGDYITLEDYLSEQPANTKPVS